MDPPEFHNRGGVGGEIIRERQISKWASGPENGVWEEVWVTIVSFSPDPEIIARSRQALRTSKVRISAHPLG